MSTNQILFGVALILVLAVGSQVLASRLRIPALIILLPAGFTAGADHRRQSGAAAGGGVPAAGFAGGGGDPL
jgi:hypothetical protein